METIIFEGLIQYCSPFVFIVKAAADNPIISAAKADVFR